MAPFTSARSTACPAHSLPLLSATVRHLNALQGPGSSAGSATPSRRARHAQVSAAHAQASAPAVARKRAPYQDADPDRTSFRKRVQRALNNEDINAVLDLVTRFIKEVKARQGGPATDNVLAGYSVPALLPPQVDQVANAWAERPSAPASRSSSHVSANLAFTTRLQHTALQAEATQALQGLHARIVRLAIRQHQPQAALNYIANLKPEPRLHSSVMHEFVKHGSLAMLQEAVKLRSLVGMPIDRFVLSNVVSKAGQEGRLDIVQEFLDAVDVRTLDAPVFNAALDACARQGSDGHFDAIWQRMTDADIAPDAFSLSARAKLLVSKGRYDEVVSLTDDLITNQPDLLSPHLLTATFAAAARTSTASHSLISHYLRACDSFSSPRSNRTISAYLAAVKEVPLGANEVETVFAMLSDWRAAGGKADVGIMTNLLQLCARNGYSLRVLDVWALAVEGRLRLNPHVLSQMLVCCTRAVRESRAVPRLAERIRGVLQSRWLEQSLTARGPRRAATVASYRVAFNALLTYYAAARDAESGLHVFKFMGESGPEPDHISYNAILNVCGTTGQASTAEALLHQMTAAGLKPDNVSFCSLLDACAKAREVGRAQRVLQEMQGHGIEPGVIAYTSVMDACVREGSDESLRMVMNVMDDMHQAGVQPSAISYCCALAACEAQGDITLAFSLYKDACERGVLPTDELHNRLIRVCANAGRVDDALDEVKALLRKHGAMQAETLNSLTRSLCDAYIDRALYMLRFMALRKMQPSYATYQALVASCARASMPQVALKLYNTMRAQGFLPSSRSGSHLVIALSHARNLEAALLVLRDMLLCADGVTAASSRLRSMTQDDSNADAVMPGTASRRDAGADMLNQVLSSLPPLQLASTLMPSAAGPAAPAAQRGGGSGRRHTPLRKGDMLPDARAVAELVLALCLEGQHRAAMTLYKQLREQGLLTTLEVTQRLTMMYEQLIELNCRGGHVQEALGVFDDWKAARDHAIQKAAQGQSIVVAATSEDAPVTAVPRLSTVTLAFLEACCHAASDSEDLQWRVYDVCALMRQQREENLASKLPQPVKGSHHVGA